MYNGMALIIKIVLFLGSYSFNAYGYTQKAFGSTTAWTDFDLQCPGKEGVNGLKLASVQDTVRQWVDFKFEIFCRAFVPQDEESQDDGEEKCRNTKAFNFGQEELLYEDEERNCKCNEYVKGLIGQHAIEKTWTGWDPDPNKRPFRLTWSRVIRLKCCTKSNNFIDIQTCGYVGPKNLYHPVGVHLLSLDGTEGLGGVYAKGKEHDDDDKPKEFLTGLSTTSVDDIIAGFCTYAVLNFHPEAKKLKKKIKKGYCDFFMMRSMMEEYDKKKKCEDWALHGWPRPFTSSNNDVLWVHGNSSEAGNLLFRTQETVCRDGNQIRSFHKYARRDPRSGKKDYVFLTQCMDFEGQACICEWNTTCDEKHWAENPDCSNETAPRCSKYIAGFRSSWNKDMDRREIELFCCISTGMKLVECNLTTVQKDHDVQVVLPYPRFSQFDGGLGDARGFRDIRVQWEGENMYVQYDVCRWNASDFPPCSYPCFPQFEMNFTTVTQTSTSSISTTTTISTSRKTSTSTSTSTSTTTTTIATTTTTKSSSECSNKYDIMILLDDSLSISENNPNNYNSFTIGQTETRMGLIRFDTGASLQWGLTGAQTNSLSSLQTAILNVPYAGGSTCIRCSLLSSAPIFTSQGRPGIPQIAFLFTDGVNNIGAGPSAAATALRNNGVNIFAVGVSSGTNVNELVGIVGGDASRVIQVTSNDYATVLTSAVITDLVRKMCSV